MNYELVNVNHHNNGIAIFRCFDTSIKYYLKVAVSEIGNTFIKNELNGYEWYYSRNGWVNNISFDNDYYCKIKIPYYNGWNKKSESGIKGNEGIFESVIDLYKNLWKMEEGRIAIHGDLVISNIIINRGVIYLIDWEHFHKSEAEYWGYDIIHMLFIAIYYNRGHLRSGQKEFLKNSYKSLCDKVPLSSKFLEKPFQNSQQYLLENAKLFSPHQNLHNKFILLQIKRSDLELLDLMITKNSI
ncbi:MAG: hypothetical protein KKG99_05970 [Bacteroidetes bacterium]|nr:hypothetical protein [Bacteroidota bacterium]